VNHLLGPDAVSMVFLMICMAPSKDRLTRRYTNNMPLVCRR
jgi:hypothetical protein